MKKNYYLHNLKSILNTRREFQGWGRKKSGRFAEVCHQIFGGKLLLLEDGFIRSLGLGIEGSPSFSLIEDDMGIYYDATSPSRLEDILNTYGFKSNYTLMKEAKVAIEKIKKHYISKYNNASLKLPDYLKSSTKKVLIVAQTLGDASLKYGLASAYDSKQMVLDAIEKNPGSEIYLKVHPDVLSNKKKSNIDISFAKKHCNIITENINPIVLLTVFDKVYTQTSQMGFEALLLDKEVICYGIPFYIGWGIENVNLGIQNKDLNTKDRKVIERVLRKRKRILTVEEVFAAAYILYTRYDNPYRHKPSTILDTIHTIVRYRDNSQQSEKVGYFFGFSTWKHSLISPFVTHLQKVYFINPLFSQKHLKMALRKGLSKESQIYIWGKKPFDEVEYYAKENSIPIYRIEDGFIRSVGLGSDLTQPYSLVIDSRGIYFDPREESELEHLLNTYVFSQDELERAEKLREDIIEKKLSKYNTYQNDILDLPKDRKIVLVPGQVEDDASIRLGAKGMSNLELLMQSRRNALDAYIVYKPHPDVLSGNRVGHIEDKEALKYCDQIVKEVSLDSILSHCNEVHTMTSLVGFEAILRGIKVHTYGLPFYAGWGLSHDAFSCRRRKRVLSVNELVAATLLLYPKYIDPKTKQLCEVEVTLDGLQKEKEHLKHSCFYHRKIQIRNFISRKLQILFRFVRR